MTTVASCRARISQWVLLRTVRLALAACLMAPAGAAAQPRWNLVLTPSMDPLPVGFCSAIHLTVQDSTVRDVPRNSLGNRVTIADFDIAVTSPDGLSAMAQQIDAHHWLACACQGATPGTVATVTATYPFRSLSASSRIPGVSVQRSATFALSAAKGSTNPAACPAAAALATAPASVVTPSARIASGGSAPPRTPQTAAPVPVSAPGRLPAPAPGSTSPAPAPGSTLPAPANTSPAPATSSPAPAPLSGNYLVTVTGVRAFQTSYEHLTFVDGT